jgi:hypothetical protein
MAYLTKRQFQVLEALEELGGEATTEAIANKLKTTINGTAQVLGALAQKEQVRFYDGCNKNSLWHLTWDISPQVLTKWAKRVLKHPFWIPELKSGVTYSRLHDDSDGHKKGYINVYFDEMGDARFSTDLSPRELRFRTPNGGGMSLHTRAALMILALGIHLDNEDRPQE